jgi:hypothetical protein
MRNIFAASAMALCVLALINACPSRAAEYAVTGPEASPPAFAAKLKPGDLVTITSGAFSPVGWKTVFAAPGVTVKCAPGATLAGWQVLRDSANVTVDGCNVVADAPGTAAMIGFGGGASANLTFRNFDAKGAGANPQGRGGGVIGSGVTLENFKVHDAAAGFSLQGSNIVIRNGECWAMHMDCAAMAGTPAQSNITFDGFYIHDLVGSGLHHDGIQVLQGFDGLTIHKVIYIKSVNNPDAVASQFLFFSAGNFKFTNLKVTDSGCYGCGWEAGHITGAGPGSVIENNWFQGDGIVSETQLQTPWLQTNGATPEAVIRNNVAGSLKSIPTLAQNVGNTTVKNGDRAAFDAWLHKGDAPPPPVDPRDVRIAQLQRDLSAANDNLAAAVARAEGLTSANATLSAQLADAVAQRDALVAKVAAAQAALR